MLPESSWQEWSMIAITNSKYPNSSLKFFLLFSSQYFLLRRGSSTFFQDCLCLCRVSLHSHSTRALTASAFRGLSQPMRGHRLRPIHPRLVMERNRTPSRYLNDALVGWTWACPALCLRQMCPTRESLPRTTPAAWIRVLSAVSLVCVSALVCVGSLPW